MQPIRNQRSGAGVAPTRGLEVATAPLRDGTTIRVRPLQADDRLRLGEYFASLSAVTRSLYSPHSFDQSTADAICKGLDPSVMLRLVATVPRGEDERIIAYFLLTRAPRPEDAARYQALGIPLGPGDGALAPSVADEF